ncbi:MFS general substrate transporter [Ramicandelaber brevisporus]|nr:MFS general substrate transporter [Ramicandelaber brevisporus]
MNDIETGSEASVPKEGSAIDIEVQPAAAEWDSKRSWVMLALAFITFVFVNGIINSVGIIQRHFTEDLLHHSSSTVVIAGSLQGAFLNVMGSPGGIATERFGYRTALLIGCGLAILALLLASFVGVHNLWLLILSHGILFGSGGAIICIVCCSVPTVWFMKRRGLANGLLMAGNGISGLVFPPMLQVIIDRVGIHWMFRILIAFTLGMGVIPSQEKHQQQQQPSHLKRIVDWFRQGFAALVDVSLLRSRPFIVLALLNYVGGTTFFMPYQYVPTYATRQGYSVDQAALAAALLGVGQIIGGLGGGILIDLLGVYNVIILANLIGFLSVAIVWTVSQQFWVLGVFSVLYGTASCAGFLAISPSTAVLFETKRLPSAMGILYLTFGIGILTTFMTFEPLESLDPINMHPLIILASVMNFSALLLAVLVRWMLSPKLLSKI